MRCKLMIAVAMALVGTWLAGDVLARGGRGGGGGRAGGGGGASRPSPSVNRAPTMSRPQPASRPTAAAQRPAATQRPATGGQGLQGARPSTGLGNTARPGGATTRPSTGAIGQGNRPTAGQVGNFLNLPQEPGAGIQPGAGERPLADRRPETRPADRADRRQDFRSDFADNARDRTDQRRDRAGDVRDNWQDHAGDFWNEFKGDFGEPGWRFDYPHLGHAYYHYNHPYAHGWWTWCTAAALTGWWSTAWGTPAYYDYGTGGNVYYEGDTVYVNEQPVPADDYAAQAQQLADSGAQQLAAPAADDKTMEWLPLGVFALSTSGEDNSPTRSMQLAVNKEGLLSGTLFNTETKKTLPIQGSVDRKTQRACWYAGDKKDVVAETGIYNLTKDETSILVHFGKDRTEEYLLVRLDPPKEESAKPQP